MILLFVGHRGTGKTAFSKSLEAWCGRENISMPFYDLDNEVVAHSGQSIQALLEASEEKFRQLEVEVLHRLVQQVEDSACIAVGAGFLGPVPSNCQVIWLRRQTDASGRSFLNRPRLDRSVSPWQEYQARFAIRKARFKAWATDEIYLPEGYTTGLEAWSLGLDKRQVPFALTVLPENFSNWTEFVNRRQHWNLSHWELRGDFLNRSQMDLALATLPMDRVLISHRQSEIREYSSGLRQDWALELGSPQQKYYSISLHERAERSLPEVIRDIEQWQPQAEILKLAVHVENFSELLLGHAWWLKDPARRSFLPRSSDGRWRWYRSLYGPKMPMHFVREGEGSSMDQPYLWQCWLQPSFTDAFAALLGWPIDHSLTPLEHRDFFAARGLPIVAVPVQEHELTQALPILKMLGLKFAAVTAPLKLLAYQLCNGHVTEVAKSVGSVNTLKLLDSGLEGHNTDVLALQCIREANYQSSQSVWLWGGGGVKSSVRAVWPTAQEISARVGLEPSSEAMPPDLLIWATGRTREFKWPPVTPAPKQVLDLNYGEDSPGLELAVMRDLPYQSGLQMFKLQAKFQRSYWSE